MLKKPIKAKSLNGTVTLFLRDMTGVKPDRKFVLNPITVTPIPVEYGESMLSSPSIQRLVREGRIIIIEGEAELVEKVIEEGYATEASFVKVDREAIKKTLLGTNITEIKKLFDPENPQLSQLALDIARENVEDMKTFAIKEVEKITQSSIQVIEE